MSKKDLLWIGLMVLASMLIGQVWMSWYNARVPNTGHQVSDADIAGFREPGDPGVAPRRPPAAQTVTPPAPSDLPPLPAFPAGTPPVRVLAAASTADLVRQWSTYFTQKTGVQVIVSSGGSNQLAQQILNGAPADLFLSASTEWADAVTAKIPVTARRNWLTGDLVLIVPQNNPAGIRSPPDLLKPELKHLALAGSNVPAGHYADQALQKLKLLQPLEDSHRIVRGSDVEVALQYVLRGEADAGIVYAADTRRKQPPPAPAAADRGTAADQPGAELPPTDPRIQVLATFPADSHDPIVYPLLLLQRDDNSPAADVLFVFLQNLPDFYLRQQGFLPTTPASEPPTAPAKAAP